jgi:hypothetical protein
MSDTRTISRKNQRKRIGKRATARINSDDVGSLHRRTLELVNTCGLNVPELFRQTGIPFYWIRKFMQGDVTNPPVDRVQKLYELLSGKTLKV